MEIFCWVHLKGIGVFTNMKFEKCFFAGWPECLDGSQTYKYIRTLKNGDKLEAYLCDECIPDEVRNEMIEVWNKE